MCCVKGGDKLTLSLSGMEESPVTEEVAGKDARSPTPVTVTHFSWGEAGKLEQRVISPSLPSAPSPPPFMSLSVTPATTNPFLNTNPFLAYPNSNPFVDISSDDVKVENDTEADTNAEVASPPSSPVEPCPSPPPQTEKVHDTVKVSLESSVAAATACLDCCMTRVAGLR